MPFINSKVTVKMSPETKERVKSRLGEAIAIIPGKSESWLMVGFEDEYDLYFKGNRDKETAFVEVKIFGSASADRIYIKYEEVANWGWNGNNF